jgi:hypothetical protein
MRVTRMSVDEVFSAANWALLVSLVVGVIATYGIVASGHIRDRNLRRELAEQRGRAENAQAEAEKSREGTRRAEERIAMLNRQTESLKADNLALQTVLLPRHVGLFGLDGPPPAQKWFSGIERYAGTEIYIQTLSDAEAINLANEIAIILSKYSWRPIFINESRSNFNLSLLTEGVSVAYPIGKTWSLENQKEPWFAWHDAAEALAQALTRAGLGVGDKPVSRYGFENEKPNIPNSAPFFDPPLTGVYLQIGARPVALTVQWIKQGRPDPGGNMPKDSGSTKGK